MHAQPADDGRIVSSRVPATLYPESVAGHGAVQLLEPGVAGLLRAPELGHVPRLRHLYDPRVLDNAVFPEADVRVTFLGSGLRAHGGGVDSWLFHARHVEGGELRIRHVVLGLQLGEWYAQRCGVLPGRSFAGGGQATCESAEPQEEAKVELHVYH